MTALKSDGTVEGVALPVVVEVTPGLIKAIAPAAKRSECELWAPYCDTAAKRFRIDTPARLCWWLGQGLYECDQLRRLREPVSA